MPRFSELFEFPPPPPKGYLEWNNVPAQYRDRELEDWLERNKHICDDPQNLFDLSFAVTMHKMGVYTPPSGKPKMPWWNSIKSFFKPY
jgi:hypothetical protein